MNTEARSKRSTYGEALSVRPPRDSGALRTRAFAKMQAGRFMWLVFSRALSSSAQARLCRAVVARCSVLPPCVLRGSVPPCWSVTSAISVSSR